MYEASLNPYFFGKCSTASVIWNATLLKVIVLILIFLENALRHKKKLVSSVVNFSLNPYFFGKCSTATTFQRLQAKNTKVLILIFLENALRHMFC